jgi:hypothetical protein
VGDLPASTTPREVWGALGGEWKRLILGARWGGDFTEPDVNHFDLGFSRITCEPTVFLGKVGIACKRTAQDRLGLSRDGWGSL